MLDDAYQPLGKMALPGFARGLLAGLDAGLEVRASDRPQSIAGWRPILGQFAALAGDATVVLVPPSAAPPPTIAEPAAEGAAAPARRRGIGLWIGAAAAVLVVLAGGYYALVGDKREAPQVAAVPGPSAVEKAAQDAQMAAEAQRLKDQEELAKLRADSAAREKAEQDAAQRRQIEEETRRKIETEMADKQRQQDEARQKAASDAAATRKAEEDEKKAAEMAENGLRLTTLDRQHVQVALGALGFGSAGTDGTLGARTREMIAAWQKAHNVSRFDDDQKKLDEAKKKADEEKAKAEAAARAAPPPQAAVAPPTVPAPNSAAAATPKSGPDGTWRGTIQCTPSRNGGELLFHLLINVVGGTGTWVRPGSGSGTGGVQSVGIRINGRDVVVSRVFTPANQPGTQQTATMRAQFDGGATISGAGPGHNGGGRTCQIVLTRQ
jgi:peptidoglycan hydrolase-like protein with peptidoglycan-binding domain